MSYAQIQNPVSKYWIKLDVRTGRIVEQSEIQFQGVELLKPRLNGTLRAGAEKIISRRLENVMTDLRMASEQYDDLTAECRRVETRVANLQDERADLSNPLTGGVFESRHATPIERVAAAFGAAMYGDNRPWGSFDEREQDALKRGAHAALSEARHALTDQDAPTPGAALAAPMAGTGDAA